MNAEEYIQLLDANSTELDTLLNECASLDPVKSENGKWGAAAIAEHILITEKVVHNLLLKPSDKRAEQAEIFGKGKMEHLLITKKEFKVKAPAFLEPRGEIKDLLTFQHKIQAVREAIKSQLSDGTIQIDNRTHPHPTFGELTISDWLYFLIAHTRRHMEQMRALL